MGDFKMLNSLKKYASYKRIDKNLIENIICNKSEKFFKHFLTSVLLSVLI